MAKDRELVCDRIGMRLQNYLFFLAKQVLGLSLERAEDRAVWLPTLPMRHESLCACSFLTVEMASDFQ